MMLIDDGINDVDVDDNHMMSYGLLLLRDVKDGCDASNIFHM